MQMRPGGHEIQVVTAPGDGTLEFQPNQPTQHHRILEGKNFAISYAPQNRVEGFRATNARTHTDPTEAERKRNRVTSTTVSRDLIARFDPKTSHLAAMEQNGDFIYEEGDRKARATKAVLDSSEDMILLDGSARISDSTGSTSADHIRMKQSSGDFTAEGDVNSTRLPDKDPKKNSDMLSGDSPMQARAKRMDSANHNSKLHYEGGAQMWQGANRIQADTIDLDREKKGLTANGNVVTHLWEQPKDPAASTNASNAPKKRDRPADPVLTVVHAPHLVYTDADRLAIYSGGATLTRSGTNVKAREIRAFLTPAKEGEDSDSRLDKAFADGSVEIVQVAPAATRTGTAEHAEYYPDEQKVFLRDGGPKMTERHPDGETKVTTGEDLTYFAGDDRLLVKGTLAHPGKTTLQRKAK
jgi:lipopolysaccharide export system protein LptA